MKRNVKLGLAAGVGALALAAAGAAILVQCNTWKLDLTLNGQQECILEYGESYIEEGASAHFYGTIFQRKGRDIPVNISGQVDTTTPGTYQVVYSAAYNNVEASETRTVLVVDTQPPVITLNHTPGSYTLPGQPYEEEGFTAVDNCDGDLTSQVIRWEDNGTVYYSVVDSSGNEGTAQRAILYDDPIPPELTLAGEGEISLYAGDDYAEPGYTATDNVDGDLTGQVVVTGQVNPLLAGSYPITYSVTDSYGNTAQASRTVVVKERPVQKPVTQVPEDKVVYLTFDDGPGPYTADLLSVLEKYNVKATFFVTAGNSRYLDMIAQEAKAGHAVGIHSYTHDYSRIYASDTAFFDDLAAMNQVIEQQTGGRSALMRFPGGSSNEVSKRYCSGIMSLLVQEVSDQGYTYFDWNVTSGDAGETTDTQTVVNNVISGIQSHSVSVVLQHDTKNFSVAAVEQILQWGLENGYTFLPLNEGSYTAHHSVHN